METSKRPLRKAGWKMHFSCFSLIKSQVQSQQNLQGSADLRSLTHSMIKGWEIQGAHHNHAPFLKGVILPLLYLMTPTTDHGLKGQRWAPDPRTVIEIGLLAYEVAWPKELWWFEALRPLPMKCVEFRPIKWVGRAEAEKPTERSRSHGEGEYRGEKPRQRKRWVGSLELSSLRWIC